VRTIKNRFLEVRTARDIDAQVAKILRGLGNPTGPIILDEVRELLNLDRKYYSSVDDGFLQEIVSKVKIAGKQVASRPMLIIDVIKKFEFKAFWVLDRKRIMIDQAQPEPKWRWNETHEIIHSIVPWHAGAMMGDTEYSLTPDCHEQIESEANYGAGRLLFLQEIFDEVVRSSPPCFDLVQKVKKQFGNTLTTSFWRLVETLSIPALGVVGKHPRHDRQITDPIHPFRYFIRSFRFLQQFSSITEPDILDMIESYCSYKKRGPLGEAELVLKDDNGREHVFFFETFSNTYDVLTLYFQSIFCSAPFR
jgi:Zn-dependent peptidase ImmA (M78 family)